MKHKNLSAGRPFGTTKNPVRKDHPMYRCWSAMKQRCLNPNSVQFKWYGARGIRVDPRWLGKDGFKNFYADMGDSNGLTIDRINNDGDYGLGNCRWATMKDQAQNRRRGKFPDPTSLRQRARAAGLPYLVVYFRLKRLGWSEVKALSIPKLPRGRISNWKKRLLMEQASLS